MEQPTVWLIVLALLGSPVLGVVVAKYFRPNATPLEVLDQVQEERNQAVKRAEAAELREAAANRRANEMQDYAHLCRAHIMDGRPPPPPPWPSGAQA